jgi:hypothetical protein
VISAFGVDHGDEVSKGFVGGKIFPPGTKAAMTAGKVRKPLTTTGGKVRQSVERINAQKRTSTAFNTYQKNPRNPLRTS